MDIATYIYNEWRRLSVDLLGTLFPDEQFFVSPIVNVLNYSKVNYPMFVNSTDSVHSLIHIFRSPTTAHRLHRVAVLQDNKMINLLSQSDIVSFLYENIHKFPNADISVEELKLIHSPIMITIDSTFADALLSLCNNKVSGIALVDSEFKLTGNLSASDLRGVDPACFEFFNGSILQFLSKQSSGAKPTKFLKEGSTFKEVTEELIADRIHRIFIITPTGFPKGVISLIDIISVL